MLSVHRIGLMGCARLPRGGEVISPALKTLCIVFFFAVWTGLTSTSAAGAQQTDEAMAYKVKAAFLLNFSKFISWPEVSSVQDKDVFRMCVLGDDPFGSALASVTSRTIGSKKVELNYADTLDQVKDCQLLFISTSEKDNLDAIQIKLGNRPVAMVSDIEGFAQAGGTIEFVSQENKLTFKINLQRARAQGLNIHSALLNLALEVIQ